MTQLKNLDIAIYLRRSRADIEAEKEAATRGETFDTLARHRTELLSMAKRDGHTILDIFEDVVSGEFIGERPEMQLLLENVRALRYDAVLVMDIDRLGRGDKIDQGRIERAFKESQTLIVTPSDVYDLNDESGEFNVEVRTFLARFEYKKIKKRLQEGRNRSAREGKDVGQKPPYGYDKDEKKRLVINDDEAKVVRMIYDMCINGLGRVQIADRLTEMGILSPTGKKVWSHVTVRKILENPKYKGDQVFGRVRWIKQEDGSYKTKRVNDPSKLIISEGAHDPIIDRETWDAAQQAIKSRIKAPVNKNLDIVNPFAGIIRCKKCGKAILANNPANRPNMYLFCGTRGCKQKMVALSKVEDVLLQQLEDILINLKAMHKKRPKKKTTESVADLQLKRIDKKKDEIDTLHRQKDSLHDFLERGVYDTETFLERNRKLQEKIKELETELEKLESAFSEESSRTKQRDQIIPNIELALEIYQKARSVTEKNKILKSFIREIRYNREQDWNEPNKFELEIELFD